MELREATAPCHARARYYAVSTGGVTAWRLTANGLLARDYLGAPDAVYCPDTRRKMGDYTSRKWLDWKDNYYWKRLQEGAPANPWSDSACPTGYASFLHGLDWKDSPPGWPPEDPSPAGTYRIEEHWYHPTFTEIQNKIHSPITDVRYDYSSLMFACLRGAGLKPHAWDGIQPGCNGVMIDGSARWFGEDAMKGWVDTYNSVRGGAIPYYPSGPYGYSRFENGEPGYDSPHHYGGQKVKMQLLVRYALDY